MTTKKDAKASGKQTKKLRVKKQTLKDLSAGARGAYVKGGAVFTSLIIACKCLTK
jgi:hypothetical protein